MRFTRRIFHLTGLLSLLALAGCDTILGPNEERVRGFLRADAQVVEVPETSSVRETVMIHIETGWYPGCSWKGETWVVREGSQVVLRPFDYVMKDREHLVCVGPELFNHEVGLQFDAPGVVTIRVVGSDGSGNERVIEREIVVEEG